MGRLKEVYRTNFDKLKSLKLEIQNINVLQKKNVEQLQKDFLRYIKYKQQ